MSIDVHSKTWLAVEQWATDRLNVARGRLESPATGETETNVERGEIRCLKTLLSLAAPEQIDPAHQGPGDNTDLD